MVHPTIRRCVFWAHLVAGIAAGLIILVLAVTGLLMSFETQIVDRIERSMVRDKAGGDPIPLTTAEMLAAFEKSGIKGRPESLGYSSASDAPVIFMTGRDSPHLFHPTTGEYLGQGAVRTRSFFKTALSIHRWLTLPGRRDSHWKEIGGQITGAGAMAFLFLLVSGLVIWIPKKRTRKAFAAVSTLHLRLKGRARDWNWHNVAGIWAAPFILTICLTGIVMAYPWANRLLFMSFGETPPERKEHAGRPRGRDDGKQRVTPQLDALMSIAKQQMPEWKSIVMEIPGHGKQPLVAQITDAGRGRPDRREKITIDPASLTILRRETFSDQKPGSRARQIVRWLHTGELGGWPGQGLAALACCATIVLVWTGFALSFRRFVLKRKPAAT